jgi:hypothetical protein
MSTIHVVDEQSLRSRVSPPPPKAVSGEAWKHSETTRLLCAAAYLERDFRDQVIKHTLENRHNALGACFGVDMPTVVRHCCHARRVLNRRAMWLLAPALIGFILLSIVLSTPEPSAGAILLLLIDYLVAFGICVYFDSRARSIVARNFMRSNFKPDALLVRDPPEVEYMRAAESGNTVIYSGFNPFVGSGDNMGAWSFAIDLRKRAEDGSGSRGPTPVNNLSPAEMDAISAEPLYSRVAQDIAELNLDRVTIQDKLYINGRDIRDDKRFLDHPLSRPKYTVDEQTMRQAMLGQNEKQLRHYRCIRVVDWSGELVLSIFLRFSRLSHNLFVEASYFLLTPIAERYRGVDAISPDFKFRQLLQVLIADAIKAPFVTLLAPFSALGHLSHSLNRWSAHRQEDEQIRQNPSFDYGAAFSFRQWTSASAYRRYFQQLDKEMYLKVLEKNILDSIVCFLEEHQVDVSELKQRQTMILNQGVILSGGTMSAQNLSVGLGSKIENVAEKVSKFTGKAAAPTPQAS